MRSFVRSISHGEIETLKTFFDGTLENAAAHLLISLCISRAGGLQRAQRRVQPDDLGRRTPRAPPASRRIICSTGDCLEDHLASREGLLETRGGPRGARPSSRWSSCWQGARMGCGGRDHPAPAACAHAGGRRRARCRARSRDAVQPSSNFASQLQSLFRAFSLPFKSKIFHYLYYATEQNYDLPPKPTIEGFSLRSIYLTCITRL